MEDPEKVWLIYYEDSETKFLNGGATFNNFFTQVTAPGVGIEMVPYMPYPIGVYNYSKNEFYMDGEE